MADSHLTLGITTFSLTPDWRAGADVVSVLRRIAAAECGPALEMIGHQAWRGFPHLSRDDERAFRDTVDRLGLVPTALGVYTDLYRWPGRRMTTDEALDDLRPQIATAATLGFPVVRAALGMDTELMRRAADEAARRGVVLTFEVQGNAAPDSADVLAVADLQRDTGNPHLGLTMDFSVTTLALPAALETALLRLGLPPDGVDIVYRAWGTDAPIGQRIGTALGAVAGHPSEAELTTVVAGVLGRCGRTPPADWSEIIPLVRHAHAKFWDPDVESVRAPHAAWLAALEDAGYAGAVVSEWGGHELLNRADADALTVTRGHLRLLAALSPQGATVRS